MLYSNLYFPKFTGSIIYILAMGSTGLQKLNYGCLVFLHSFRSFLNENNKNFDNIQNFKGFLHFFLSKTPIIAC